MTHQIPSLNANGAIVRDDSYKHHSVLIHPVECAVDEEHTILRNTGIHQAEHCELTQNIGQLNIGSIDWQV